MCAESVVCGILDTQKRNDMTKKEIIDTALKGIGKARVQGDSTEPIMPYLLGDIMYQIYMKNIAKLPLRHKMKLMDSSWRQRYGLFDRPLFTYFKDGESIELTDMMDNLTDYLNDEIVLMRTRVVNVLSDIEDFNHRMNISALILCHIIAQYAECSYNRCYYTTKNTSYGVIEESASNKDLCYLRDLSYKMAMQYIHDLPGGEVTIYHPDMDDLFIKVAKKIYKWLEEN